MFKTFKILILFIIMPVMTFSHTDASAFGIFNSGSGPSLSGSVGVYVPTGYLSGKTNPGVTASLTLSQSVVPRLVDFRVSGSYANASGRSNGTSYTFNSYGVQALAVLAPDLPILSPYIGVGYGLYYNTLDRTGRISNNKHEFGHGPLVRGGIGATLGILRVGVDAQYMVNNSSGKDFGGWSIGAGAGIYF